jgi:hypothetical protein
MSEKDTEKQPERADDNTITKVKHGIDATRREDYARAIELFTEAYSNGFLRGTSDGCSYFGVAVALHAKKYREGIDLCKRSIRLQPSNPNHYVNLSRVMVAAGNRKKAVEALEQGLGQLPENKAILEFWATIGRRATPSIPFLGRNNPLNVVLGQVRSKKKSGSKKKPKASSKSNTK